MRNLLARSFEDLGVDQKVWLSSEVGGFGDLAVSGLVPSAAGALEQITANSTYDIPREDSASRSGRSVVTRLSGKKEVSLNFEGYIIPGTPDILGNPTLPPIHPFLLAAFGAVDLSNPAQIVYELSRLNGNSFRVLEERTHSTRLIAGCVAESLTFNLPGDGKAQVSMEGFGQDVFDEGESRLAQALTGVAQFASLLKQDLTYTADLAGSNGNLISVDYTPGATAGLEVVTVIGNAISVQIDDAVSTATQVKTAVDAFPAAAALVNVAITGVGGNAQTAAGAAQFLTGGLSTFQLKVTATTGVRYEVGGYIDVIAASDGNTTSNSAKQITSVGTGVNADVITVATALLAAALNDFVIGHAPATFNPITSDNALLGLKGSVLLDGLASPCEVISAEISLTNNFTQKNFLYGTSKICGYIPDKRREVKVTLEILLNRENFSLFRQTKEFIAKDVEIILSPQDIPAPSFATVVGRTWRFLMPRVEFNIPPIEQPSDAYVTLSLEGTALALDVNNLDSELSLIIE